MIPTTVSPHFWLTLNLPKFRESAREAACTVLGPAAWIYSVYTPSVRVPAAIMSPRNFPCPFCGLCFVRLGPHLPRCRQREGRDYSAFLAKAPVPPARGVCSTCGRRFKRLDTHLRVSSTCRVIFPSVPRPSPNVPSPSMNSISQTAVSTQARRIFKVDRALLARSAATRGVWGHAPPPPPKILGF